MQYLLSEPVRLETDTNWRRIGAMIGALVRPSHARLHLAILLLVGLMGLSSTAGFFYGQREQALRARAEASAARLGTLASALSEAEDGLRGYVFTGRLDDLRQYLAASGAARAGIDAVPEAGRIVDVLDMWENVAAHAQHGAEAAALLAANDTAATTAPLRARLAERRAAAMRDASAIARRIARLQTGIMAIDLLGALLAIAAMLRTFRHSGREAQAREAAMTASIRLHEQLAQLFRMTEMLQSVTTREDASLVLRVTAERLLPGLAGRMHLLDDAHGRLQEVVNWGEIGAPASEGVSASCCWALRGGKPYLNGLRAGGLRCAHIGEDASTLEIPMLVGGEVFGLLEIVSTEVDGEWRLREAQALASALADSMALALSSMALREKLHHQALRDGLTGLYNRRFLDEVLERLALDAQRRKVPLAAIMIDLDHFKKLNDQHGHAMGDRVLRDAAAAIVACLRATDLACRYGGEELLVLLPDCALEMALTKAEQIRGKIAELSLGTERPAVSASLGVAAIPETSVRTNDLLASADAALYVAKQQGRNRVAAAAIRPAAQRISLREMS
jgi:diguanylate cyclase (GGDEF)-like protein